MLHISFYHSIKDAARDMTTITAHVQFCNVHQGFVKEKLSVSLKGSFISVSVSIQFRYTTVFTILHHN